MYYLLIIFFIDFYFLFMTIFVIFLILNLKKGRKNIFKLIKNQSFTLVFKLEK